MDLEGNIVNSIIFGAIFALIVTGIILILLDNLWKDVKPDKFKKPIIVLILWIIITIFLTLRNYYSWF